MRREGAVWMSRGQLGAALVLVAAVSTATFFLGYLLGEGGAEPAPVEASAEEPATVAALIGPELEQDSLTELLARVDLVPNAQAATLEFPSELSAHELEIELPAAPPEEEPVVSDVLPEPESAPPPPEDPTEVVESGWALEVDSFADRAEAQAVVDQLKEEALPATLATVLYGGQTRFRVRVGPFNDADDADALAGEVSTVVGHGVDLVEVR